VRNLAAVLATLFAASLFLAQLAPVSVWAAGARGGNGGGGSNRRAIDNCQRAVEQRLNRDGYGQVDFRSINVDTRPGRGQWIVGDARANGRNRQDAFDFSCYVNFDSGEIRSVDVNRR
jgi:hypothetical protein